MNKQQAKERIKELREKTEYYAKKYYDDDNPEISDFEYDMLMVELRNLEKEYPELITKESLTQKVGGHVKEGFEKVTHEVPLQSLQDVFSLEDVEDSWTDDVNEEYKASYEAEKKDMEARIASLEAEAAELKAKYKERFFNTETVENKDDISEDIEEKKIIDVKEI